MSSSGPAPVALTDVTHLATTITARLRDPDVSAVDLALALHPTPAVAGTPRAAALAAIRRLEPTPRDLYAGPCGWVDARGDGEFVVALRGAQIEGTRARLHAGAGIVAGSRPPPNGPRPKPSSNRCCERSSACDVWPRRELAGDATRGPAADELDRTGRQTLKHPPP